jgi:hypothetical protein
MSKKEYPLDDGAIGIVYFRPKIFNEEELIDRVELKGSNGKILRTWDFSGRPRTRKEAAEEITFLI